MGRLDGKIAAVTGGASGIGEATVRRFIAEGASVAFCDRDGERGQRVAAELEAAGAKVAFTQADVGTEAACLAFVNGAAQKFGRLDILINNAGIRKYEKVDEASAAALEALLAERADEIAAIVVEPLVQGAGGMRFHDARVLRNLRALADRYELLLILDEIFTGFGRAGSLFAFQAAGARRARRKSSGKCSSALITG